MRRLVIIFAALVMLLPAYAQQNGSWGVDADGAWSQGANWSGGQVATGAANTATFTFGVGSTRTVTVDQSPWNIGSLLIGSPANNWIITGGTLSSFSNIVVTLNTATINSTLAGGALYKSGAGTLDIGGTGSTVGDITVVGGGTLELLGSASLAATNVYIGYNGSNQGGGVLNVKDSVVLSVTNAVLLGNPAGVGGTVNQSGGIVTYFGVGDNFRIAHWGGETSVYNLSGGTLNAPSVSIRLGWDGTGIFNISGGTFNGNVYVGRTLPSLLNISGGMVNSTYIGVSPVCSGNQVVISGTAVVNVSNFWLGEGSGQAGTVCQSNGAVTVSGQVRVGHWPSETSYYYMNGGSLTLTGTPSGGGTEYDGILYVGVDGTGMLIQTGGVVSAYGLVMDGRSDTAGTDTYTLNGGRLSLGPWGIGGNPSVLLNFGGGVLAASASWSSTKPITLTGINGDTTFDAGTNTMTLSGVLSGTGGVIKAGSGLVRLTAINTYSGVTTVSTGALVVAAGGSISNSTGLVLGPATVLDSLASGVFMMPTGALLAGYGTVSGEVVMAEGAIVSPGQSNTLGTLNVSSNLTLGEGTIYNWQYDVGAVTGDLVRVGGNLVLPASGTVNVSRVNGYLQPERAVLFSYEGTCSRMNFSGWVIHGGGLSIMNDTVHRQVLLVNGLVIMIR